MSKNMMKLTLGLLAVGCALACISSTQAEIISSSEFSLGYGFVRSGATGAWNTSEIASPPNTGTTIGDFTFLPTFLVQDRISDKGPRFPDRVLSGSGDACAYSNDNDAGTKFGFGVSIAGSWAGDDPPDAATDPGYHIQLNITNLKIWGGGYDIWGAKEFAFRETTVGHGATSTYAALGSGYITAAEYLQLTWNPDDYATEGVAFARGFDIVADAGFGAVDGFEVFGTIDVTYNAIPEPGTMALLATGLIGLLCYAWRKRK